MPVVSVTPPQVQLSIWMYSRSSVDPSGLTRKVILPKSVGALDPTSGGSASVNTEGVTVDFQTTEQSGVTLPASVQPGDTWTQTVTLEGTETIGDTQIPAKNQFSNTCKAVGVESVTVAAGTFDALRVECQTNMVITVTMQGNDISTPVNFQATNWYVQGVGLVKTVSTGSNLDSTIELAGYTIP